MMSQDYQQLQLYPMLSATLLHHLKPLLSATLVHLLNNCRNWPGLYLLQTAKEKGDVTIS